MMHAAYEKYVHEFIGPMAVARSCALCKFVLVRRRGGGGRGQGFREGNRQRGALIQHLKDAHPAEYAAAMNGDKVTPCNAHVVPREEWQRVDELPNVDKKRA